MAVFLNELYRYNLYFEVLSGGTHGTSTTWQQDHEHSTNNCMRLNGSLCTIQQSSKACFCMLEEVLPSTLSLLLVFVISGLRTQKYCNWEGCFSQLFPLLLQKGWLCKVV